MEIRVCRFFHGKESTGSLVAINGNGEGENGAVFECFGLEDQHQDVKVMHETRIPNGTYDVKLREYGGHHERYKKKFDFHKGMLQVMDVPGFTDILIHIGNTEKDTSGCLLLGESITQKNGEMLLVSSTVAYIDFYKRVLKAFESGENVTITYLSIYE